MKNNLIQNSENYLSIINENEYILFIRFVGLIHEYVGLALESIYIQDKPYLKYVLCKGVNLIFNVYNFLLLYSQNLDLALYHTQKAFYYYIEFIGQIGNDNHSYLKLNSKDAYLFVLKKTICEINNDKKKEFEETDTMYDKFILKDKLINIYIKLIQNIIYHYDFNDENNTQLLKIVTNDAYKIAELLIQFNEKEDFKSVLNKLNVIDFFCDHFVDLYYVENNGLNMFSYLELFIKKNMKQLMDYNKIEEKFKNKESILENFKNNTYIKFINYIIV